MSMSCMNKNAINNAMDTVSEAYHSAALQSMKSAANKVINSSIKKTLAREVLIRVSIGGTFFIFLVFSESHFNDTFAYNMIF